MYSKFSFSGVYGHMYNYEKNYGIKPTQMKILEYGYLHSNAVPQFCLKLLERYKPHITACHPTKWDVINYINLFSMIYSYNGFTPPPQNPVSAVCSKMVVVDFFYC